MLLSGAFPVKIVLAPDSFKEGLRAIEVATALEQGLRRVLPDVEYVKRPDGRRRRRCVSVINLRTWWSPGVQDRHRPTRGAAPPMGYLTVELRQ